jgi:hypothetical protein
MAAAVAIEPEICQCGQRQAMQRQQTHISLNLVFASGSTTNSGGVKVVQLSVLDSAEQLYTP